MLTCSVCIATYRRPELLNNLLTSLVAQLLHEDVRLEILVVDNDSEGSAAAVVARYRDTHKIVFRYFRQPVKNISLTRNLAVSNATGTHLLFIDDDEVACPDWAASLLTTLRQFNADAVVGPSLPMLDNTAPEWIRKGIHCFVDTIPDAATGTEAQAAWSGNCLVRASLLKGLDGPFNPAYGITGGEDGELFDRLKQRGARFVYCREAEVCEYWAPERARVAYLVRRSLFGSNAHTRTLIAFSTRRLPVRVLMLLKAVSFGLISLMLVLLLLPHKVWRTYWALKVASNVGRFLAAVGIHYQTYK